CAECHGFYGRGDGALARQLGLEPADLATLRERNGGEFPYERVYAMIDGRHDMDRARAMPAFGEQFIARDLEDYGEVIGEALTDRRIQALVRYVESLQLP